MQEDGASPAFDPRSLVVPEIDDDIVKVVVPLDGFVSRRVGETDLAIVTPVMYVVAPAIVVLRLGERQARPWPQEPVGAIEPFAEGECANGCGEIAFAFGMGNAIPTEGAGKL